MKDNLFLTLVKKFGASFTPSDGTYKIVVKGRNFYVKSLPHGIKVSCLAVTYCDYLTEEAINKQTETYKKMMRALADNIACKVDENLGYIHLTNFISSVQELKWCFSFLEEEAKKLDDEDLKYYLRSIGVHISQIKQS